MSGFSFTKPFGSDIDETYELFIHNFDDLISELDLFIEKQRKILKLEIVKY